MLKHFQLGHRANFPAIFLFAVVVLYCVGYALWGNEDGQSFVQPKNAFELLAAVVGTAAALVYFLYRQHHQDTQMFVSLFEKFNTRYNHLNERLNAIVSRPADSPFLQAHRDALYDYFNLCAEEHLFYEAGYIDEMVWRAWLLGMKHFARDAAVRRLWEEEIITGSYYHFQLTLLDALEFPKPLN
jgi:hypothetical protein